MAQSGRRATRGFSCGVRQLRDGVVRLGGRDERPADGRDTGGGHGRARPVVKLLEIRELAGGFVEEEIHAGITEALKSHPEPTMVFSMHGN